MKSARWILIAALISSPFWYANLTHLAIAAAAANSTSSNVTVSGSKDGSTPVWKFTPATSCTSPPRAP